MTSLRSRVLDLVQSYKPTLSVNEDSILNNLGFDDLDRVSLSLDVEDAFEIELTSSEHLIWNTVSDIEKTVRDLLGADA